MLIIARSVDQAIYEVSGRHHGAIGRWQLRDIGVDRFAERRRVDAGMLRPAVGPTFFVGPAAARHSHMAFLSAAVLAGGPDARLGGEQLAALHGWWNRAGHVIDVWSPLDRRQMAGTGVRFHRLRGDAPDPGLDVVQGIRSIGVLRMLSQLGETLTPWQVPFVLSECECAGMLTRPAFEQELAARTFRRGMYTTRQGWANYLAGSTGTHNASEDRLLERLLLVAEEPLVNVRNATRIAGVIPDFTYPRRGKVIELDGRWVHGRPGAAAADTARDKAHRAAGWQVLRVSAQRVWRDLDRLLDEVVAFLD
jgi:very-short-patch-repair endonuclease